VSKLLNLGRGGGEVIWGKSWGVCIWSMCEHWYLFSN